MTEKPIRVILVDDEPEASRNLKSIIEEYIDAQIQILAIANNTAEAEKLVKAHQPDALFLDIEMPNENAFQFLDRVSPINFEVVFVTAYDEYAVRAFKLNAVDYILKPISITELQNAVAKLKDKVKYKHLINQNDFGDLNKQIATKQKVNRITLKDNNNVELVAFKDLIYIEAFGKYSKVFFVKNNSLHDILTSYSISDYEDLLPTDRFYRIHKSFLINCGQIKKIHKDDSSSLTIYNNIEIPISRRRFSSLLEFLQSKPSFDD
ncbi:MAG: DNA-binding response regulator [Chitinophagia bacterium]|nr:DNA-binding response regulator [Chitinophagia bacterium]